MKISQHGLLGMICLLFFTAQIVFAQDSIGEEDTKVILTNEATINTQGLEFSPAFYEDGIVFITTVPSSKRYKVLDTRIDMNIMSIFRAKRNEDGLLMAPEPFAKELLAPVHQGPLTFDRTNERVFFTRNNYKDGKMVKGKDREVKMQIYSAKWKDPLWSELEKLPFNDDNSNYAHPSISVDDDRMYFSSDRPGGFGGMDIWYVDRVGKKWGEPVNLGDTINTATDDVFPHSHADGTLYFVSGSHSGYGGLDIFSTTFNGTNWTKPINLGQPFNSDKDDIGFIVDRDKKNGYFSSNRDGGLGKDDIYSFYIATDLDAVTNNTPVTTSPTERNVDIIVIDNVSGNPVVEATVNYMNLDDLTIARAITAMNEEDQNGRDDLLLRLSMDGNSLQGITDYDGKYPMKVTNSNYVLNVEKPGYKSRMVVLTADSDLNELLISLKEDAGDMAGTGDTGIDSSDSGSIVPDNASTEYEEEILNSTISEGSIFELPNIYYNFNDARIRPDARIDLDALHGFLVQYPDVQIELGSHTDSRGGTRYNRKLSQRRADNAVEYLVNKGISPSRLRAVGYGEDNIRNHCTDGVRCSETEHQYNRRTEVQITRMDKDINVRFVNTAPGSSDEPVIDETTHFPDPPPPAPVYSEGDYKIISGVYSKYENAERKVRQLQDKGYSGEIVDFGNSGMHTVIVARINDRAEANRFARELRKAGFNIFVKDR